MSRATVLATCCWRVSCRRALPFAVAADVGLARGAVAGPVSVPARAGHFASIARSTNAHKMVSDGVALRGAVGYNETELNTAEWAANQHGEIRSERFETLASFVRCEHICSKTRG